MPTPRACRTCGADLAPDIRWCTRCYAPVTEFAARERLHDGYVGMPQHEHDSAGHWSRWEATPTTFGPVVRVGGTIFIVAWLAAGFIYTFFVFWFIELFLGGWLVKDLWKKGWVVADDGSTIRGAPTLELRPEGPRVPRPERPLPVDRPPVAPATIAAWVVLGILGLGALLAYVYGGGTIRVVVTLAGTLLATYAFFRSILKP